MRLVHTARSPPRPFSRFSRTDKTGRNIRELDVMASFRALVDRVIAIAPDVMIIAGDVLDSVRPKNPVVIDAFIEFRRLTDALPRMVIVMVAGNHDFPAAGGHRLSAAALQGPRHHGRRSRRPEGRVPRAEPERARCAGHPAMIVRPAFAPDPECRFNVAVLHGEVEGMSGLRQERAIKSYKPGRRLPASWDYIGSGTITSTSSSRRTCIYSGSIDYSSNVPWGELSDEKKFGVTGKGFVERDLVTGEHTFHSLPTTRDHIDLSLDAGGMGVEQLNTAMDELLDDAWPDMAIARVVITGCPLATQKAVSSKRSGPSRRAHSTSSWSTGGSRSGSMARAPRSRRAATSPHWISCCSAG
jgi:exonuclease SbcD